MEDELIHELAAAYALDALDQEEEQVFERHLARCDRCRRQVAAFTETAAALAFAVEPAQPPAELRGRILAAAQAERARVVALRPRWAYPALVAAAAAACAAIGLGVWAATLHSRLASRAQAMRVLPLSGVHGSLVVAPDGQAALVVSGLDPAPAGRVYEVWIMRGQQAQPVGLFHGRASSPVTIPLRGQVRRGDQVGVTLEPAGGSPRPTSRPLLTSPRV